MSVPAAPAPDPATPGTPPHDLQDPRRVVVVRDRKLGERLQDRFNGAVRVEVLPGALTAMADVANHGAGRVVIPADTLRGIERSGLQTFVEAGVGDGVVILDADEKQRDLFADAGVTRFATTQQDDKHWRDTLGLSADAVVNAERNDQDDTAGANDSSPPEEPRQNQTEPIRPTPTSESVATPPSWSPALPLTPHDAAQLPELGDSDLVEAILEIGAEGGRRAPLLAVALAQQQSGIKDLAFAVRDRSAVPDEHAAAEVAFRGRVFGRLHAPPPATAGDLQPWAHWLARWVALEQQTRQLRDLAMKDELTGVWNRRYFNRFLRRIVDRAADDRQQVTLLVFDIDNFKTYNDAHGHAAGDEILKSAAELMQSVVRDHDVVARIGGDEFAVIFWDAAGPRQEGSSHPDDVLNIAKRFQQAVCELKFPALARSDMDTLTISGGLAGFPWDGRTPEDLLHHADMMALESKNKGKNAITFGSGALRCEMPRDESTE